MYDVTILLSQGSVMVYCMGETFKGNSYSHVVSIVCGPGANWVLG